MLISASVAPRTEQQHRATLLSINSLAGRLFYGGLLQVLAINVEDDPRPFLQATSVISWILVALLLRPALGPQAANRQRYETSHRYPAPVHIAAAPAHLDREIGSRTWQN